MIARDHHYLFTHTHLRNQALRSADKMLSELSAPTAETFLFFLWQQVEEVAAEKVGGAGLNIEGVDACGGGTLAVIRLPAPERAGESLFAALHVGPSGPRYFVFDRSAGDPSQACLAELELDETRINLGLHPASKEALLSALNGELANTPAPRSQPPVAATMAMSASAMGTPAAVGTPPPMGAAPLAPAPGPGPKKKKMGKAWLALLAIPLVAPIFCCGGIGILAYDSGLAEDAAIVFSTAPRATESDSEQLVISVSGPEEISSYSVTGPGAEDCDYLYSYSFSAGVSCTIDLSQISDPSPSYHVVASGHGPQMFGENLGDRVTIEETIEVDRNPRLEWSEIASTTVVRGFPGRLEVTRDGFLRLVGAPAGATLIVGPESSSDPRPLIGLDLAALTNQVGVMAVLRDGGRVSVSGVTIRLPDGTQATGTAQLDARDLSSALVERLSLLGDADLGEAGGEATLWLQGGRLRSVHGAPRTLSDVGRVIVTESRESPAGRCGPYALYGVGYGSRVTRTRWLTTVTVYDRVEERREARRRFRGDRPSCPRSIAVGTREIHGVRNTADADAYALEQLAPPEDA